MIIGEERPKNVNDRILAREVTLEKTPDGKESLKITVKASRPGGQESSSRDSSRPAVKARLLVFCNVTNKIRKRMDTTVAFTQ